MSSVSSVSSLLNQYQVNWQNNSNQVKQDFSNLITSLQSGDLSGAQQLCGNLIQDFSTISQAQTSQIGATGIQADLNALGQAIQSGDTDAAKTDFSKLQQDLQGIQGGHHHHHHHFQGTENQSTPTIMDPFQINTGSSSGYNNSNSSSIGTVSILA